MRKKTSNQDLHWSRQAASYDEIFLDPYGPQVENPLWAALDQIDDPANKTVADLGCGTGPLLPHLIERFGKVVALDFAASMIKHAQERLGPERVHRVVFEKRPMYELDDHAGQFDVALTINSLVMPDVRDIDRTLRAIRASLKPGGVFLGIVPSMDAIHYHTMLVLDHALQEGASLEEAETRASLHVEHAHYDFTFGRFRFRGLRQKFWQPFEVEYRFAKAGFTSVSLAKVLYPWDENLPCSESLSLQPRSWDWFFRATP
ncbi:MAG: methyltransferase type 12 [Planctomycetes bacterium SCN 63-9]|nr:MAG: methyltransferase type 12 [Planctomycetes bacterium SCN 63-9]